MNKLRRATNDSESLDIKKEDGHQPNKKKLITNFTHSWGEVYGIYEKMTQISRQSVIARITVKLNTKL